MTVTSLTYILADLTALAVLVGALYARRHGRKDLIAAYLGINVGVLAVTLLMSTASIAAGLGLGLFGVLSIIRLRSAEISQGEIAYFFAALALGLMGGIQTAPLSLIAPLMALVVARAAGPVPLPSSRCPPAVRAVRAAGVRGTR